MDRKELIGLGDASIRKALANMFAILNKDGEILTKIGGDADRMAFSPRLECDKDCSVVLFDDEDKARGAMEEIIAPQDDGEYHVFKFTAIDDGEDDDDGYGEFEIEFDSDEDGEDIGDEEEEIVEPEDAGDDDDGTFDSGEMSLDDAIEHAREVGSKMLEEDPDCDCGKQHLQLAKWLEELKSIRGANGEDEENKEDEDGNDEDDDIGESVVSPSIKDIRRILKRNGYQLVSQKNSAQHWKKSEDEEPIVLPCTEDTFDGTKWSEIVKSRGLTTDFED